MICAYKKRYEDLMIVDFGSKSKTNVLKFATRLLALIISKGNFSEGYITDICADLAVFTI